MMKARSLWANRWKHRLVFNETLLEKDFFRIYFSHLIQLTYNCIAVNVDFRYS